jgi:uncharacterized membrane protein YkvA (DUF1232 family)
VSPPDTPGDDGVNESTLRTKLLGVPSNIVEKALLLYALLTARDTPAWVRALVLASLAYLINPFDLVPDFAVGVGYADDLAVLALALERASRYVTPAVREASTTATTD